MKNQRPAIPDSAAPNWPWIAIFFGFLLLYLPVSVRVEDDAWFSTVFFGLMDGNLFEFLSFRYETWSTRLILEALMIPLLRFAPLYKLAIASWFTFIAIAAARLLKLESSREKLALGAALFLIPIAVNSHSGYVCSTINYIFTTCCFLWAIMPAVERARGKKPPLWADLGSFVLMVIACNMELYCIPFLLITLALLIRAAGKKRFDWQCLVLALIAVGSGLFAALSPVNTASAYANSAEELNMFPGFELLSMAEKLVVTTNSTAGGLISTYARGDSFIIGTLTLGLLLAIYGFSLPQKWERAVWLSPFAIALLIGIPARLVPADSAFGSLFYAPSSGFAAPGGAADWTLPLILALLFFASILWCCFRLNKWLGVFMSAALVSRLSMITISVYASGMRTFYLLLFAMCAAAAFATARLFEREKFKKISAAILALGAGAALIINLVFILT